MMIDMTNVNIIVVVCHSNITITTNKKRIQVYKQIIHGLFLSQNSSTTDMMSESDPTCPLIRAVEVNGKNEYIQSQCKESDLTHKKKDLFNNICSSCHYNAILLNWFITSWQVMNIQWSTWQTTTMQKKICWVSMKMIKKQNDYV